MKCLEQMNQINKTTFFGWVTPKNFRKTEKHNQKQTQILRVIPVLTEKEKIYPLDDTESRQKIHERFDWTDTLLTEFEKQENEDFLVWFIIMTFSPDTEMTLK